MTARPTLVLQPVPFGWPALFNLVGNELIQFGALKALSKELVTGPTELKYDTTEF